MYVLDMCLIYSYCVYNIDYLLCVTTYIHILYVNIIMLYICTRVCCVNNINCVNMYTYNTYNTSHLHISHMYRDKGQSGAGKDRFT